MSRTKPWEVSDALWAQVEPILEAAPVREAGRSYRRRGGGGRKRTIPLRTIFAAIVRVLRSGCQWNTITRERDGVSSSCVHGYFSRWQRAGVFEKIWRTGLAQYDEMEGIAWRWQSVDSTSLKAPLAQESVGPNPTDRGKKWEQNPRRRRRAWRPALASRQRRKRA